MASAKKTSKAAPRKKAARSAGPRCGLCGKSKRIVQTECCGNWICDDEDSYQLFSYARNSCFRNHRRYTICGYHSCAEHPGPWQECQPCREGFKTEMYVAYATNEYNFTKLENPPAFEPTLCSKCSRRIVLADGGYVQLRDIYTCGECFAEESKNFPG